MSTDKHAHPRDHLEAGLAWARARIAGVRPEQLDEPTPCQGWTVRQVVQHLVDVVGTLPGALRTGEASPPAGGDDAPAASSIDDALAELDRHGAEALELLADDDAAHRKLATPFGAMPAMRLVMITFGDLAVHGWDLARATGQDEVMPDRLAGAAYTMWRQMPLEQFRKGGAIGAEVALHDEEASTQDRLLALLGRDPG